LDLLETLASKSNQNINSEMIKLYLQNQDEKPITISDEFFETIEDARLKQAKVEEKKTNEIESITNKFNS
jgi:hypothetical protein